MTIVQHYIPPPKGEQPESFSKMFEGAGKGMSRSKVMSQLSEKEKEELQKKIWEVHEQMMDVFKNIPPRLFLVFRYGLPEDSRNSVCTVVCDVLLLILSW